MRSIALDAHRDFCEVAIADEEMVRSAGRGPTRVASLKLFAQSLAASDVVALEATTGADAIVSLLQAHGIRVVVANTRKLKGISDARAKTDRLDARLIARMLRSGLLDQVWTPDERTRTLRRLTNRRERLVRARTRAKNEAHGVLARTLCERPPVTDAFGKAARRWLAQLELPAEERLTLDGCLRDAGARLAGGAAPDERPRRTCRPRPPSWPRSATSAASPLQASSSATSASIRASVSRERLRSPRPHPQGRRRGGPARARRGRLEGDPDAGPLRAFFDRVRARRGPQIAATATARKLVVFFWHLLRKEQDYAFARPAMTRQQDPRARAPRRRSSPEGSQGHRWRQVEGRLRGGARALPPGRSCLQAPRQRLAREGPAKSGCGHDTGARTAWALEGRSGAADSISRLEGV